MDRETFERVVTQAALAPSIHNAQPARWRLVHGAIWIGADLSVGLPEADPNGAAIALSCGAAIEATVLALSQEGYAATVTDVWADDDKHSWPRHRMAAVVTLTAQGNTDGLAAHLPNRFTWRGAFSAEPPALFGWSRADTVFVFDQPTKAWIAELNDAASLHILRRLAFRQELLSWFRLTEDHPRANCDGMNLAALRMNAGDGRKLRLGFGPLWPFLDVLGRTGPLTAQAEATQTAALIACFHQPAEAGPIANGRAYLRLLLEAASLGLAGWPMAALTDDTTAAQQVVTQLSIPPDQRLIQVIRFGAPIGPQPARVRRPLAELIP